MPDSPTTSTGRRSADAVEHAGARARPRCCPDPGSAAPRYPRPPARRGSRARRPARPRGARALAPRARALRTRRAAWRSSARSRACASAEAAAPRARRPRAIAVRERVPSRAIAEVDDAQRPPRTTSGTAARSAARARARRHGRRRDRAARPPRRRPRGSRGARARPRLTWRCSPTRSARPRFRPARGASVAAGRRRSAGGRAADVHASIASSTRTSTSFEVPSPASSSATRASWATASRDDGRVGTGGAPRSRRAHGGRCAEDSASAASRATSASRRAPSVATPSEDGPGRARASATAAVSASRDGGAVEGASAPRRATSSSSTARPSAPRARPSSPASARAPPPLERRHVAGGARAEVELGRTRAHRGRRRTCDDAENVVRVGAARLERGELGGGGAGARELETRELHVEPCPRVATLDGARRRLAERLPRLVLLADEQRRRAAREPGTRRARGLIEPLPQERRAEGGGPCSPRRPYVHRRRGDPRQVGRLVEQRRPGRHGPGRPFEGRERRLAPSRGMEDESPHRRGAHGSGDRRGPPRPPGTRAVGVPPFRAREEREHLRDDGLRGRRLRGTRALRRSALRPRRGGRGARVRGRGGRRDERCGEARGGLRDPPSARPPRRRRGSGRRRAVVVVVVAVGLGARAPRRSSAAAAAARRARAPTARGGRRAGVALGFAALELHRGGRLERAAPRARGDDVRASRRPTSPRATRWRRCRETRGRASARGPLRRAAPPRPGECARAAAGAARAGGREPAVDERAARAGFRPSPRRAPERGGRLGPGGDRLALDGEVRARRAPGAARPVRRQAWRGQCPRRASPTHAALGRAPGAAASRAIARVAASAPRDRRATASPWSSARRADVRRGGSPPRSSGARHSRSRRRAPTRPARPSPTRRGTRSGAVPRRRAGRAPAPSTARSRSTSVARAAGASVPSRSVVGSATRVRRLHVTVRDALVVQFLEAARHAVATSTRRAASVSAAPERRPARLPDGPTRPPRPASASELPSCHAYATTSAPAETPGRRAGAGPTQRTEGPQRRASRDANARLRPDPAVGPGTRH